MNKSLYPYAIPGLSAIFFFTLAGPVYANAPIFWGLVGGSAPFFAGLGTRGIAFVVIIIIESLVFRKYLALSWKQAIGGTILINFISSIAGLAISGLSFSSSFAWLIIFLPIVIYLLITIRRIGVPPVYIPIIIISLLAGSFAAVLTLYVLTARSPVIIYLIMVLPLLIGFGLTLIFESLLARMAFKHPGPWKALLIANIYSYIFLALVIPFTPISISGAVGSNLQYDVRDRIVEGEEPSEIIDMINRFHGSNLYLLGLVDESPATGEYDAWLEIEILSITYTTLYASFDVNPDTGLAIVDYGLGYDQLKPESRVTLEWYREYLEYWKAADDALYDRGWDSVSEISAEWNSWFTENPSDFEKYDPNAIVGTLFQNMYPDENQPFALSVVEMEQLSTVGSEEINHLTDD